jgi:hypothetical protein
LQGRIFHGPIRLGRGVSLALFLAGYLYRHEDQNETHQQGKREPSLPGPLPRSLIYKHTHTHLATIKVKQYSGKNGETEEIRLRSN